MAEKYDTAETRTDKRKSRAGCDDCRRGAGTIQRKLFKQQNRFSQYNLPG